MRIRWIDFTRSVVEQYCAKRGLRTFTLHEFLTDNRDQFQQFAPQNRHIDEKVRQQLQRLRDAGVLRFVDMRGTYTLQTVPVLPGEVVLNKVNFLKSLPPDKREYLVEVFARNRGWVALARKYYGSYCMFPECSNTFKTPRGVPYIEVHHIVALCEGGEEALWNLSVVCAHHHRMAHFADRRTRIWVANTLKGIVEARYSSLGLVS